MTASIDLNRLEQLAAEATPGPWGIDAKPVLEEWRVFGQLGAHELVVAFCDGRRNLDAGANADLIAACDPATVTALIRAVRALERINSMPTAERNPDGEEQAAHSMQLVANEAIAPFRKQAG